MDLQAQAGSAMSKDKLHDLGTGPIVMKGCLSRHSVRVEECK
ncbi:hypothetical protein ACN28E_45740 [Archangium lansingense]